MIILVCGGGNICHAAAGMLSHFGHTVRVLTRRPAEWTKTLTVHYLGETYTTLIDNVGADPTTLITGVQLVIIACPIAAVRPISSRLGLIKSSIPIVFIPGRLCVLQVDGLRLQHNPLLLLQRTPYISRIQKYGQEVSISGTQHGPIRCVGLNGAETQIIGDLFQQPCKEIQNQLTIDLNNSNTLLHTCRLHDLFCTNKEYSECQLFYAGWTDCASTLLIDCDQELQTLLASACETVEVVPIVQHYSDSSEPLADAAALTSKIVSITAFQSIQAPMIQGTSGNFEADISSRYFSEDLCALSFLLQQARKQKVDVPSCKMLYDTLQEFVTTSTNEQAVQTMDTI